VNLEERLKYCRLCRHSERRLDVGLICSLTGKKPDFEGKCEHFEKDPDVIPEIRKKKFKHHRILSTAGIHLRILNGLIDQVMIVFFFFFLVLDLFVLYALFPAYFQWFANMGDFATMIFFSIVYFLYYFLFESFWGRTVGKWITHTVVVNESMQKPSLVEILFRTLLRYIPFEWLSVFDGEGLMIHDRSSGTRVVMKRHVDLTKKHSRTRH